MTKPFILFITGTSASGKTTLYESLKTDPKLKEIIFHDIDEKGVPPVGRGPWRKFRVEELLYEAIINLDKGKSTIICGISKPHEVVESRYFKPEEHIHFLHVKVPYGLLEARIKERVDAQDRQPTFDEVFNRDAMQETLLENKKLLRELSNSISQQKNGHSVDAEQLTKKQMHDEVVKIIHKTQD